MNENELQRRLLARFNLRAGGETTRYVMRQLDHRGATAPIPVMGGDAKTGVAVRLLIDPKRLTADSDAADRPQA